MRRLLSLLVLAGLVPAACSGAVEADRAASEQSVAAAASAGAATLQPDDRVDLTLYFRAGEGPHAHLERVTREVSVDQDLPLRSLELLLAGPVDGETNLSAALPPTTQVRELDVQGGTARVVLSPEAIRDASTVGDSPANEALALAAIANTLTEFPSVERVRVEVLGQNIRSEEFWGGWGLPAVLVRDETLVGTPSEGGGVPDLGRFTAEPKVTGSADAPGAHLASVRVRDHLTHVRFIVELADPDDPDADPKVPRVRARAYSDAIVIDLSGVTTDAAELAARELELSDPAFRDLRVASRGARTALRVAVDGARGRLFWLHSMTGPTRVVLDVKK